MEITDYHFEAITAYLFKVFIAMGILSYTKRICNLSELKVLASYLQFEDITFCNPSVNHYNLQDKKNDTIAGYLKNL